MGDELLKGRRLGVKGDDVILQSCFQTSSKNVAFNSMRLLCCYRLCKAELNVNVNKYACLKCQYYHADGEQVTFTVIILAERVMFAFAK